MDNDTPICRVCGATSVVAEFSACDANRRRLEHRFNYFRCSTCGSLSLYPLPCDLATHYEHSYPAFKVQHAPEVEKLIASWEAAKIQMVRRYVASGYLIEVGPASGRFLSTAKEAGFTVAGIEQDANCCEYIRWTVGVNVVNSDNPAMALLDMGQCDVLAAWHVIEHLLDIGVFLEMAAKAVRPGGVLIFSSPNPKSWSFTVFGRHWVHLDAPRHVSLIPVSALDKIVGGHGFERVGLVFCDPVGLECNRMGWMNSANNLFMKVRWQRVCLRIVALILSKVMRPFDALPGRGSAYTVIYRRKS